MELTFLEAVRALQNGECEGIKQSEGVYTNDNGYLDSMLHPGETRGPARISAILSDDWQLVNPRPLTEKREVKLWVRLQPGGCVSEFRYVPPEDVEKGFIELTGTYNAPIPRKVKRREELGRPGNLLWSDGFGYKAIPSDAQFFAEWEEEQP